MEKKYYQIDEAAKLADTTKRTIRYYEDLGLLTPARTDASYRLYTDEDVDTIREILGLRGRLGMNLSEVQRFMGLKKSVSAILSGSVSDIDQIREAEEKLIEVLKIIDDREATLKRIRSSCRSYLDEISKTAKKLEK